MKDIAIKNLDNKEVVERWKNGGILFSASLGGIGPGYEQEIQNYLFDIFTYLVDNNIDVGKLSDGKQYSSYYDEICDEICKKRDLTGAMYGVARGTAYQFYRYGYAVMMKTLSSDRLIQTNNTQLKVDKNE